MVINRQVLFNSVQKHGLPQPGVTTRLGQSEIDLDTVALNGGALFRNVAVSLDPTMRNRMKGDPTYFTPPYEVDSPIRGIGIAEVIRSEHSGFAAGDLVFIWDMAFEEYSVVSADVLGSGRLRKMDLPKTGLSITTWLGAAGMPGMTAWMSIKEIIGDLKPGNKMFVTGAAGAVGQLVVQIAKNAGVQVIASAGSEEKCNFLRNELGADVAFNYKTADVHAELKKFAGDTGIHYYFDNVGGDQLEAYIEYAARYGIIIACGYISGYNAEKPEDIKFPKNLFNIVKREIKYQGFIVSSFIPKWQGKFLEEVPAMLADGRLKATEDVTFGVLGAEDAFLRLFTGDTEGKVAVLIDVEHAEKWNLKDKLAKAKKVWQ